MAQIMRPISDNINTGGVPTTNGYLNVDGVAPDTGDYWAGDDGVTGTLRLNMTDLSGSTPGSGTCTLRFYHAQCDTNVAPSSGGTTPSFDISVRENLAEHAGATALTPNEGSFVEHNTLTFEASAVTDWSNIDVLFTSNGSGGKGSSRRGAAISYVEISVPDTAAGPTPQACPSTGTGTAALTMQKTFARSFTMSGVGSSVYARALTLARSFTYGGTGSSVFSRLASLFRSFSHSGSGAPEVTQGLQYNNAYTYSGVGTSILATNNVALRSFAYSGVGTASYARQVSYQRELAYAPTGTVGISKGIQLQLQHSGFAGSAMVTDTTLIRSLTYSGQGTSVLTTAQDATFEGTYTGTATAAIQKAVAVEHSFDAFGTVTRQQDYGKVFVSTGLGSSLMETGLDQTVEVNVTGTGTPTLLRDVVFGRVLNFVGTASHTLGKFLSKVFFFVGRASSTVTAPGLEQSERPLVRQAARDILRKLLKNIK